MTPIHGLFRRSQKAVACREADSEALISRASPPVFTRVAFATDYAKLSMMPWGGKDRRQPCVDLVGGHVAAGDEPDGRVGARRGNLALREPPDGAANVLPGEQPVRRKPGPPPAGFSGECGEARKRGRDRRLCLSFFRPAPAKAPARTARPWESQPAGAIRPGSAAGFSGNGTSTRPRCGS